MPYKIKYIIINPFLVKVTKEDDIISEASDSVSCWHLDDKGKHVIDESIERFVHKRFPGQMRYGLPRERLNQLKMWITYIL